MDQILTKLFYELDVTCLKTEIHVRMRSTIGQPIKNATVIKV